MSRLPPEDSGRRELKLAMTSASRAAELARQMLLYSGKGRFVIERLDLGALVDEGA